MVANIKESAGTARRIARLSFIPILILIASVSVFSIGDKGYVEFSAKSGSFRLAHSGAAATIYVDSHDYPGVIRAASDFQADVRRVTSIKPSIVIDDDSPYSDLIIIGTIGKSRRIDELISSGKIDVDRIKGVWEGYLIQTVEAPFPNVKRALVIAGSDKRGTVFGIYDVSEQIGVSPWYWWADVSVTPHASLFVKAGIRITDSPKIKYRGIFLNDEAPALSGWTKEKFGGVNHKFYAKVFELLLRLKANFLWPAMWGNAFYDDDPENAKLADEYGIVMSTSHHEPMMRAQQEWKRYGKGDWNYETNGEVLRKFWTEGVSRGRDFERIITLAMRGDGDTPMSREANTALLERIVADQRKIIADNVDSDLNKVPQVWALYKEVQEYYEKGMRVPDGVTLLWCDDNWGNIRRLPTAEERKRSGGAGVYYHFDYVGGPRNYKWLNTIPITKIWEQMNLAYEYDARRIWVVNVGDLKPMEFPIEFFLNQAWNPEKFNAENLDDFTRTWAVREFGNEHAAEIAEIVAKYTKYNSRRKPEMLEPTTFSLSNYREAETAVDDYNKIARRAEQLYKLMPANKNAAFYQLVLYPAKACANLLEMYVAIGKNRMYAVQGRASTNAFAKRATDLFYNDAKLSKYYNKTLSGGKWNHLMDQTRIGYTNWQQPPRNAMPGVQQVQVPLKAEMGIAVEGAETPAILVLPVQNVYDQKPHYFEIFNRGQTPFKFTIAAKEPWIKLSETNGTVGEDQRIWVRVDWALAPTGASRGMVAITGGDDQKFEITVPVSKPEFPKPTDVEGFVESDGYVAIDAEHYTGETASNGVEWKILPDFGRTLSGVTLFPVTSPGKNFTSNSPHLDYKMYLFNAGPVNIDLMFAPTQNFCPTEGFRFGISFDDDAPKIINFHEGYTPAEWNRSVGDGVRTDSSKNTIASSGYHTLKYWAIDPGIVLEKIVVNTGGLRPSYLGPPESFRQMPAK